MKNFENRFQVNQDIIQLKYDETIRKGTVIGGPFNVEGVSHYHVKWNWCAPEYSSNLDWLTPEVDLISDMVSTKYMYA
tara:strand:- start:1769 stop:2002 length:234 start_codon:yes stop_codon:yes gene_type:complete